MNLTDVICIGVQTSYRAWNNLLMLSSSVTEEFYRQDLGITYDEIYLIIVPTIIWNDT